MERNESSARAASVDVNAEEVTTRAFDALERARTDVMKDREGEFGELFIGSAVRIVAKSTLALHNFLHYLRNYSSKFTIYARACHDCYVPHSQCGACII